MSAAQEETTVTYEELQDIEHEFEEAENEIGTWDSFSAKWPIEHVEANATSTPTVRQQYELTRPLFAKRHKIVSQIPNFWPLVIEQAPPDIDEYIQPTDSALLLSSLVSLSVSRFEIENGAKGDPRSVSIRWEFSENDYFEDRVLEKKFWHRKSKDGWAGLVSEPVDIRWKKGKDLTGGLLGMVKRAWDEEQALEKAGKPRPKGLTAVQRALKEKIDNTGLGGLGFFAWFGFRGERVTAEESRLVQEKERERRQQRKNGVEVVNLPPEEEDEEDEEDDLEIFPDGDNLAVCIADDLWPGAIRYFSKFCDRKQSTQSNTPSSPSSGARHIKRRRLRIRR